MELRELTEYAAEKYQIYEQRKWAKFPQFSVLTDPRTNTWVALLMRQWDSAQGRMTERCDIKCGRETLWQLRAPYLTAPVRMTGNKWVGVTFTEQTDAETVKRLFDRAMGVSAALSYTVVLESPPQPSRTVYHDTPLDFSGRPPLPPKEQVPKELRALHRMYEYGRSSFDAKCRSFYRQAKLMERYEDDAPWQFTFVSICPTYQDLTTAQQRGYFAWRTQVRRGEFHPIATAAAYLYLYELLNGVGAASPAEALSKLKAFEHGFLDAGYGDERMRQQLCRWMFEFAVVHDFPPETARECAAPEMLQNDNALAVLQNPREKSDEEVFAALCFFAKGKLSDSPAVTKNENGMRLFSEIWRYASAHFTSGDKDFFTLCFGEKKILSWRPLYDALCLPQTTPRNGAYALNDCRTFYCRGTAWLVERYDKLYFNKNLFQGLLHAADFALRKYLKTGRYLHEKPGEAWAKATILPVLEADKRAREEAARPKITVDLSRLEQIRKDAVVTRDSLLTEEELTEEAFTNNAPKEVSTTLSPDISLGELPASILRALLNGDRQTADALIREHHLMPSIVADEINEAFFDEIGDTVVLCDDDRLSLTEDYIEEILEFFKES